MANAFGSRKYHQGKAPPHSWVHNRWYSRPTTPEAIAKYRVAYLLCTPHGPITIMEEYFCWIYLVTGKYRLSKRMAYGRPDTNILTDKLRGRLKDLQDMHDEGIINLAQGPWKHYKLEIGDQDNYLGPSKKDYFSSCLER